jgi:prepilin-type N-terminal cleavage/methylation domain-containing protein
MKSFKRGEKGFTLIELLIVVAILGVLAAVVIPNVVGLMGRGGKQALQTDEQTIQLAVSTFVNDAHAGFNFNGNASLATWGNTDELSAQHFYPCALAAMSGPTGPFLTLSSTLYDTAQTSSKNYVILGKSGNATTAEISDSAVWMGLLVNAPGTGNWTTTPPTLNNAFRGNVSVLNNETGLYLQNIPRSASGDLPGGELGNGALHPGGYTWVVGLNGTVYGAYTPDDGTTWYSGYSGAYP